MDNRCNHVEKSWTPGLNLLAERGVDGKERHKDASPVEKSCGETPSQWSSANPSWWRCGAS